MGALKLLDRSTSSLMDEEVFFIMERLLASFTLKAMWFWRRGVFSFDMLVHIILPREGLEAIGAADSMLRCPTPFNMAIIMLLPLDDCSAFGTGSSAHDVTYRAVNNEVAELGGARPFL